MNFPKPIALLKAGSMAFSGVAADYNADGKTDLKVGGKDKAGKPSIWIYLK